MDGLTLKSKFFRFNVLFRIMNIGSMNHDYKQIVHNVYDDVLLSPFRLSCYSVKEIHIHNE